MNAATQTLQQTPPMFDQIYTPALNEMSKHRVRFFVQLGWESLSVDTQSIADYKLPRCLIRPCQSFLQLAPEFEIPEGQRVGDPLPDREGRPFYSRYWRHAAHEADRLNQLEANITGTNKTGITEIKALAGRADVYERCQINTLFYGDQMPARNDEMIAHLEKRVEQLRENPPSIVSSEDLPVVIAVGEELIEAARVNAELQMRAIEYSHSCMKLSPKDQEYKRVYDTRDEELLVRTGQKRIHHADQATASALELLAGKATTNNSSREGMEEMIRLQREEIAFMRGALEQLLAERGVKLSPQKKEK